MLRLVWVVLLSLPFVLYYFWKCGFIERHPLRFSEYDRYLMARRMIRIMKFNGFIRTKVYGKENLPQHDGYVMYANHQGKYDVLGIIGAHKLPCTYVVDEERSHLLFVEQFTRLLKGIRLDKGNIREQVKTIFKVVGEVRQGRRVVIFPEGGYDHNHNKVGEFLPGAFQCATKAKSPIVPVALIDSYKVFELNSLGPVRTQVHFLKPIFYDEYKSMNTHEIAELVKERIQRVINENL